MKLRITYASLLIAALAIGSNLHAQSSKSNESEIVMTQEELDSFLAKIAELRKQQIAKRKEMLEIQYQAQLKSNQKEQKTSAPSSSDGIERLQSELDRLNNRIDLLLLNMAKGGQGTTYVPSQSGTTVIYQQPQPSSPNSTVVVPHSTPQPQPQTETKTVVPDVNVNVQTPPSSANEEAIQKAKQEFEHSNAQLQSQMSNLNEEVRVLRLLSEKASDKEAYEKEIQDLNKKIAILNDQSEAQRKAFEESQNKKQSFEKELKDLENYKHSIYFDNNKYQLRPTDIDELSTAVEIVHKYSPRVTMVVRGFASNVGNAKYNNELSYKRAESVRQALLKKGLKAEDIMVLYHGVDSKASEAEGRRVELTLLVQ